MTRKFLFIVFLLISGCTSPIADKYYTGANIPFYLEVNQTAFIKQYNMSITFISVEQDSRCPEGARCVWEGNYVIKFLISLDGIEKTLEVDSSNYSSTPNFGQYKIQMLSLTPERTEVMDEEYKVELLVSNPI